jgi:hypothetical protein
MKEDKLKEAINEIMNTNIRPLQDASDQDLKNAVVQELKLAMKQEIGRAIGINRAQEEERNRIMNLLRGILIAEGIILLIIVFPWFYFLFNKNILDNYNLSSYLSHLVIFQIGMLFFLLGIMGLCLIAIIKLFKKED